MNEGSEGGSRNELEKREGNSGRTQREVGGKLG